MFLIVILSTRRYNAKKEERPLHIQVARRNESKMKGRIKQTIAYVLVASLLNGCSAQKPTEGEEYTFPTQQSTESVAENQTGQDVNITQPYAGERPTLIKNVIKNEEENVIPSIEPYVVAPDLSNIDNLSQFYLEEDMAKKLSQNGFVVYGDAGNEFFEIYEQNRYSMAPNFVTVDSMMHTYHLYFSYLLKNIERDYLADSVTQLSKRMLENSIAQYDQLKKSEWEDAAKRNVAFFTVGAKLLDSSTAIEDYVMDTVQYELSNIQQADHIMLSELTGDFEDYSQYIPRGYYEGDETLESYFKAMMWYGRIHFSQNSEKLEKEDDLDRSAFLITKALMDDAEAYNLWESVYAVTSFFAGASDDLGVCEYAPVIRTVYGDNISIGDLAGDNKLFETFHEMTATLSPPQINSIPIRDGEDNVILGFRFMGQRFTIDAAIMQKLVYSNVGSNSTGEKRMFPDVLDVPAALGSDTALNILTQEGATDYEGYVQNMEQLKASLSDADENLWTASLYANWINTLRPLLTAKGEGYPMFMQSEDWTKKNLECFAGSFTELKHDTVLYTKQVLAEMGGWDEELDNRGYVEPEPLVYERFANLASLTAQGLKEYKMLCAEDEDNLIRLSQIAERLLTISNKELKDEVLTAEEYEFIECYGGTIEHFWYEAVKEEGNGAAIASQECPAAVVVDIATDPNGAVLEAATGNPSMIYVIVKVDGKIKIARGSVYSFYQFEWSLDDRLTDLKWHQMMGIKPNENGEYQKDASISKPSWTDSYRYQYH